MTETRFDNAKLSTFLDKINKKIKIESTTTRYDKALRTAHHVPGVLQIKEAIKNELTSLQSALDSHAQEAKDEITPVRTALAPPTIGEEKISDRLKVLTTHFDFFGCKTVANKLKRLTQNNREPSSSMLAVGPLSPPIDENLPRPLSDPALTDLTEPRTPSFGRHG